MKARLASLSTTQKLALFALLLGVLAVFLGSPYQGRRAVVDARELAINIERAEDHVTVQELAKSLIAQNWEYRLLDVRSAEEYAEYHIPTAEHVAVAELPDYPLLRNEKILLYSNGGIHASQAALILKAMGFQGVYTLLGGMQAWKDGILFPILPTDATPEQIQAFEKAKQMAKHFGGSPRTGVTEETPTAAPVMPKIEAPMPIQPLPRQKKAREGC